MTDLATSLTPLDWRAVEASLSARDALRFGYPMLALVERLAPGTVAEGLSATARHRATRLLTLDRSSRSDSDARDG